jgi:chromate transport protein ChrA
VGAASSAGESDAARLRELALLFLRLGATAFGGPAAHMALMKREVVDQRKWLTPAQLLDLIAATNLIPGPSSTELAIHIGQERAGQRGAVVAGACFILPATLVTLAVAWLYVEYGHLPRAEAALYGMKPVIVAIVAHALFSLARVAVKSAGLVAIGLAAVLACALGVPELAVLGGAAAIAAASRTTPGKAGAPAVVAGLPALVATAAPSVTTGGIFLVFLKIGSVLFGSGYVLVAFLRADLVEAPRLAHRGPAPRRGRRGANHARDPCSRRRRSSATSSTASPARARRPSGSSCRPSCSSPRAGGSCLDSGARRPSAPRSTASTSRRSP